MTLKTPIECEPTRSKTKFVVEVPCPDCGNLITKDFDNGPNAASAALAWYRAWHAGSGVNRLCEPCEYKRLCEYRGME